jgi:hypothetical protein
MVKTIGTTAAMPIPTTPQPITDPATVLVSSPIASAVPAASLPSEASSGIPGAP